MSTINTFSMGTEEMMEICNQVKNIIIDEIWREKIISDEIHTVWSKERMVIVTKPSIICSWFKNIMGKSADTYHIFVGKISPEQIENMKRKEENEQTKN